MTTICPCDHFCAKLCTTNFGHSFIINKSFQESGGAASKDAHDVNLPPISNTSSKQRPVSVPEYTTPQAENAIRSLEKVGIL